MSKEAPGFEAAANCGGVGASVSVLGEVVASKGKGQEVEIKAEKVEVSRGGRRNFTAPSKNNAEVRVEM